VAISDDLNILELGTLQESDDLAVERKDSTSSWSLLEESDQRIMTRYII
jgi:hypothetical protein